jgi:cell division protein FtsB
LNDENAPARRSGLTAGPGSRRHATPNPDSGATSGVTSGPARRPLQPRRPGRTRQIVRMLLLLFGAVIIVDAVVGDRGLLAMLRAQHQYDELVSSIARQRTENDRLREEARRLREDPDAIEEIARRELGLIRRGEKVFIVKDLKPQTP